MIPWIAIASSCFTTLQHVPDNKARTFVMNLWNSVKRRMTSQRAKITKPKVMAGVELVGAGCTYQWFYALRRDGEYKEPAG